MYRNYNVLFGALFNNIQIVRTDANNAPDAIIDIPLSFASKEKMLTRVLADPNLNRQEALIMPQMSWNCVDMQYDGNRKLQTVNRLAAPDITNKNKALLQYVPVPYNFQMELYIYVKNLLDGAKIIEQVLPYFTPDWSISANLIPEMGFPESVPIVFESITFTDQFEGQFQDLQVRIYTLKFVLKGYLYGPIRPTPVIKFANVNFWVSTSLSNGAVVNTMVEATQTTPGAIEAVSGLSNVTYTFANVQPTSFSNGEVLIVNFSNTATGNGIVVATSNTQVTIANTQGIVIEANGVFISNTSYVFGASSHVNAIFTSAVSTNDTSLPTSNATVSSPPYNIGITDDFDFIQAINNLRIT